MPQPDTYLIRPAGRHVLTIGRELIQDQYAAIVELVKNAYDADSPSVTITFKAGQKADPQTRRKEIPGSIVIEDHGHGMSKETVINKWLVPSTDDKQIRKLSPGRLVDGELYQRVMQGRKGIGRYAASLLGDDLLLETVTPDGEKTTVYVQWSQFESKQYLDQVEILVQSFTADEPQGTRLTISANPDYINYWNKEDNNKRTEFDKLKYELKKLVSPVTSSETSPSIQEEFEVFLKIEGFKGQSSDLEKIEPFQIFELYDYKVVGKIGADGKGVLTYSLQKARNTIEESIKFDHGGPTNCGDLYFDIRVYDREKEAIDSLIRRGLKDERGNYFGNLEARRILNIFNGIGVYRNGFRIRPLGDPEFDWLELNKQRIQNPSMKIGSNQAIGYVLIESEEQSHLIEKSARDGLRENLAFSELKTISQKVIAELEKRRFIYRKKAGLSRPTLKLEQQLERMFSFNEMKRNVRAKLIRHGIDTKAADEVLDIITKDEEDKNKIAEEIRQEVAVYQGQATLGKIIYVVLHDGRRPLNYFKNQIPNLHSWIRYFEKTPDTKAIDKLISLTEGIQLNADVFVKLFSRLDPLAAGRRSAKASLPLVKTLEGVFAVFTEQMSSNYISFDVKGPADFNLLCWQQDIYAIFTNLIDNSIFWILEKKSVTKHISIDISVAESGLEFIDYRDTGPGIEPSLISSGVIFDPRFSTKPGGTGLGLAIAGEASMRNGLELKVFESDTGAYFRLQPVEGDGNES